MKALSVQCTLWKLWESTFTCSLSKAHSGHTFTRFNLLPELWNQEMHFDAFIIMTIHSFWRRTTLILQRKWLQVLCNINFITLLHSNVLHYIVWLAPLYVGCIGLHDNGLPCDTQVYYCITSYSIALHSITCKLLALHCILLQCFVAHCHCIKMQCNVSHFLNHV